MSDKTDMGGHAPAHPVVTGNHVHATGITVWDYFAAAALQGYLAGDPDADCGWEGYASDAANQADAMLAERTKRTGGNS